MNRALTAALKDRMPLCPYGCARIVRPGIAQLRCPVCEWHILLYQNAPELWDQTLVGVRPEWTPTTLLAHLIEEEIRRSHEAWIELDEAANAAQDQWESLIAQATVFFQKWQDFDHEAGKAKDAITEREQELARMKGAA